MKNRSSQTSLTKRHLRVRIVAVAIAVASSAALISAVWLRSAKQAQVSPRSYWRYPISKIGTARLIASVDSYYKTSFVQKPKLVGVAFQPQSQQLLTYVYKENSEAEDISQSTGNVPDRVSLIPVGFSLKSLSRHSWIQKITFIDLEKETYDDAIAVDSLHNRLVSVGSTGSGIVAKAWQYVPTSTAEGTAYEQKLLSTTKVAPRTLTHEVAISADGELFATTSNTDSGNKIWIGEVRSNPQSRQQTSDASAEDMSVRHVITLEASARDVAFSPDGKLLAAPLIHGTGGTLRLWDTQSGQEIAVYDAPYNPRSSFQANLAFSPDGRLLALINSKATYLWRTDTGQLLHTFPTEKTDFSEHPRVVAFSSTGKWLASSSGGDGTITFWDTQSGKLLRILKSPLSSHGYIAFNADDTQLAAGAPRRPMVTLWQLPENLR